MLKIRLGLLSTSLISLGLFAGVSQAQVSSDGTVNTRVTSANQQNFEIDGGRQAGGNLFHSFSRFSIPSNGSAVFNNGATVANIFGRVTGTETSNINGKIGAKHNANLFLLNSNGIVFGPNAILDIGGSFFASSADSVIFEDGTQFSNRTSTSTSILTISAPTGLQFGDTAGAISVKASNLSTNPGQTLALVGGHLTLTGSRINAPAGRIELGSIGKNGTATIKNLARGGELLYPRQKGFLDLKLEKKSAVNGRNVQLTGRSINFTDQSKVFSYSDSFKQSGSINILTSKNLSLKKNSGMHMISRSADSDQNIYIAAEHISLGNRSFISNESQSSNSTQNIYIEAEHITLDNQSSISNESQSSNSTQNIFIEAEHITLDNQSSISNESQSRNSTQNIDIESDYLTLNNRSFISAKTSGSQNGGIQLSIDQLSILNRNSEISTTSGEGSPPNIFIDTTILALINSSNISTSLLPLAAFNLGGEISIITQGLLLSSDSFIRTSRRVFEPESSYMVERPIELPEKVPVQRKFTQRCRPGQALGNGEFVYVGRGGLPDNPTSLRSFPAIWHDMRPPENQEQTIANLHTSQPSPKPKPSPIVEAKGWIQTSKGLMLTAPEGTSTAIASSAAMTC